MNAQLGKVHSNRGQPLEHFQTFWPACQGVAEENSKTLLKKPSRAQVGLRLHPVLKLVMEPVSCLQPVGPGVYLTLSNNPWLVGSEGGSTDRQY